MDRGTVRANLRLCICPYDNASIYPIFYQKLLLEPARICKVGKGLPIVGGILYNPNRAKLVGYYNIAASNSR